MIDSRKVGKKILELRLMNNLTQEELADKLYVTRQALSRWERGLAIPPVEMVVELTRVFNVTFDILLCLNEKVEIDQSDIFKHHDRYYIINEIINGNLEVNLANIFYQLSPVERMTILAKIKDGTIKCHNIRDLIVKLTSSELKFLGGN